MIDRRAFCTAFDLDPVAVGRPLDTPGSAGGHRLVDAVLALAAWITAAALAAFCVFGFDLLWQLREPTLVHAGLGAGLFAAGLFLPRGRDSVYRTQFGIAIATAGAGLWVAGLAVPRESLTVAALVPAALVVATAAPRGLQLLTSALCTGLTVAAMWDARLAHGIDLLALATVAGAGLLLLPPRRDLRPSAVVLLLTLPVAALLPDVAGRLDGDGWGARTVHAALAAALAWTWARRDAPQSSAAGIGATVAAAVAALLLPPGGSAAMVMLGLAALLGSWPLAAIGAVTQVVFLWRFYADLQFDLLAKSGMLVAVGLVLIAAWAWLARRERAA